MTSSAFDLDEALVHHLSLQEGLTDLVGSRIFPDFAGQNEPLPLIVYELESDRPGITQSGPSRSGEAAYVLTVWAEARKEVMAVGRLLRRCLHGYRGAFRDIPVTGAFLEGASRHWDAERRIYSLQMRFSIHYQEI